VILSWNATNACPLACAHCYREAGRAVEGELPSAEAAALIDQAAEAGFRLFVFSGGEPLLRSDLATLIRRAAERGLRPALGTSGVGLDRARARELARAGLARAGISLDSGDPAIHDAFRGMRGAHAAALEACRACRAEGLPFQIHTTLTARNGGEIESLYDLSGRLGAAGHHFFFLVRTGRARDMGEPAPDPGAYRSSLERIRALERRGERDVRAVCAPQYGLLSPSLGRGCLAGRSYCVVAPNGDLRPCAYLDETAGNVRETPFSVLWRSAPLLLRFRGAEARAGCGDCPDRERCGGCRARALAESGRSDGPDPLCFRRA